MSAKKNQSVIGFSIDQISSQMSHIIETYVTIPSTGPGGTRRRTEQRGGFLTIIGSNTGELLLLPEEIGNYDYEKRAKYKRFSLEKAQRLHKGSRLKLVSSFQSRDESHNRFGGAILAAEVIISFSGLPELGDEACCLILARRLGWISMTDAFNIARLSGNYQYDQLLEMI